MSAFKSDQFLGEVVGVQNGQVAAFADGAFGIDFEFVNLPGGRGVDDAPRPRHQFAGGIHLEFVGHQIEQSAEEAQQADDGGGDGLGFAAHAVLQLGQRLPDETSGDAAMLDGVVQRRRGMASHHIQPRDQLLRLGGRLEALHEQRRARRTPARFALVAQRLHDQQFAVALAQVSVQRRQHFGRQTVIADAVENELLAPGDDRFAQGAHEANQIGTPFDDIGAADGLDAGLGAVLTNGHGETIALDQASSLVGRLIGDFGGMQTAMNLPRERFQLRPHLLLAAQLSHDLIALIARGQLGHVGHVLQIAGHGLRRTIGVLPNFDESGDLLIDDDGGDEQKMIGEVGGGRFAVFADADAAARRHVERLAAASPLAVTTPRGWCARPRSDRDRFL